MSSASYEVAEEDEYREDLEKARNAAKDSYARLGRPALDSVAIANNCRGSQAKAQLATAHALIDIADWMTPSLWAYAKASAISQAI